MFETGGCTGFRLCPVHVSGEFRTVNEGVFSQALMHILNFLMCMTDSSFFKGKQLPAGFACDRETDTESTVPGGSLCPCVFVGRLICVSGQLGFFYTYVCVCVCVVANFTVACLFIIVHLYLDVYVQMQTVMHGFLIVPFLFFVQYMLLFA